MTPEQLTEEKLETNIKKYKDELAKLEKKYNGMLNPKDIVREASNPQSPLNNWFDWNDGEASEKWRLHQARMLLAKIKVTVIYEGTAKEYRKYLNVRIADDGRSYVQTKNAIENVDMKKQVLAKAVKEIEYWQRAYDDYKELEDIFLGINKTKKKLKKVLTETEISQ